MVWMFRGSGDGVAQNFKGLVAILEGAVEEIDRAIGSRAKLVVDQTARNGAEVASLGLYTWSHGVPEIAVTLTDSGAEELARITSENLGRRVAVVFDGKLLCAPTIQDRISKHAMIEGDFTPAEAEEIAARITAAVKSPPAHPSPATSRLQCRLVAQDDDTAPADEFPDPGDPSGEAPKIRVLRDVLLDESAVESAQVAATRGTLPVSVNVARHGEVIFITIGEEMLADVLNLLDGRGAKKALASDARFEAAFAKLPRADDSIMFFDMQTMLKPLQALADLVITEVGSPDDIYSNTGMSAEASQLNREAVASYERGDVKQALALVEQAHEIAPSDSIVLYNLACFNALLGNKGEALTWLEKAVDGGFHAPRKITSDSDLVSLRGDPRYEAALAKAGKLAAQHTADDTIINSVKEGEAYELTTQAWKVYEEEDYERGLELVEQACELTPNDSRVLYYLACFHALLGHNEKALDSLDQAVDGGFYCPRHISNDPDLESIRSDDRYGAALARARQKAAEAQVQQAADNADMAQRIVDRLMGAVGILDHVAAVETTDGYAVRTESLAVLVPDAKQRPIYPVFGKGDQLTDFDRYLPQETESFSVSGGVDLGALYKFIEDTFHVAGPKGEELLAKWNEIQKDFGIDVEKDVFGWIDGESVSVTLGDGMGWVVMIKVSDEQVAREKVAAAVEFLTTKVGELAGQAPPLAMLAATRSSTEDERLEGFESLQFTMSPQPVVWGVADGYLIAGASADAVALCLETAKGKHPGIRENERVMTEAIMPTGQFTSVSLTDQRRLGEELATGIGMISMISGMATMAIPDPEVRPIITKIAGMFAKLTPVVRKIDFYKSTATHTTFDGQAWHTRMVTHYVSPTERAASEMR
jgi:tetratricopeptide (TPR) repeat protein